MGAPAKGRIESRGDSFVKLFAERESCNNISLHNCVMEAIKHFRGLDVYQGGKALVMEIFEVSKTFPVEERYALTDQATFENLDDACDKIIAQVVKMIDQADKWVIRVPSKVRRRA
jgi:hypothetical protein